jgi:hypothetical protein
MCIGAWIPGYRMDGNAILSRKEEEKETGKKKRCAVNRNEYWTNDDLGRIGIERCNCQGVNAVDEAE